MRRLVPIAACLAALAGLGLGARVPDQVATPPQQQQPPVFTTGVDVIRLDVSVLDKDRRPVRGLTLDDFSVYEDGKLQKIVAVSEIDAILRDPLPSAWMRYVPRDVSMNDLADQAGDGRIVAVIMDDWNVPNDDLNIIMQARAIGRFVIDQLGPSDIAAVVFPQEAGKTVDFTGDRQKLLAAIDKFDPPEVRWVPPTQIGPSGGGADMPYRSSGVLMRNQCQRSQPTIPTLDSIAARLAAVPNRRKTMVLVSVGAPVNPGASSGCHGELAEIMRDLYRKAQRANINIYSVDPGGYRGYEDYLQNPIRRAGRPAEHTMDQASARNASRVRRDFLEITANHTGADAVTNTAAVEPAIERMFEEAAAYYLVGYQTSNGKPDGKYRRVEVKVKRPNVTVRTRSGYYAPAEGSRATTDQRGGPTSLDLGLTGMMMPASLPLRASVVPIGRASASSSDADVAVLLTVRLPAPRGTIDETITVVRTLYDAEGRAGTPMSEKYPLSLRAATGDELRYDVFQRLTLPPGRYELRLNASSAFLDRSGSVYANFLVPDFTRPAISLSAFVVGTRAQGREDTLAKLVPVVPTTSRNFEPNETITAFLRVFQGGASSPVPVTMSAKVLDMSDAVVLDVSTTIPESAFDTTRSAPFEIDLPLEKLTHGPYLLSVTATAAGGANVRKDLVFRVR
jgi:VWFA-related protein